MFSSSPFAHRPFSAGPEAYRSVSRGARDGEFGWAAWVYSRQAKLNAWTWHGLGASSRSSIHAWAQLGGSMYLRRDNDLYVYILSPDVYLDPAEENYESGTVLAETQWLDLGKPGNLKGLTGIDFDGVNVVSMEVYIAVDGNRMGDPVLSLDLIDAQGGWTYSGGVIPLELASTEFKFLFIGDAKSEVQINRFTLYWDDMGDV